MGPQRRSSSSVSTLAFPRSLFACIHLKMKKSTFELFRIAYQTALSLNE